MKKILLILALLVGVLGTSHPATAQTFIKAFADDANGTISTNGGTVTLGSSRNSAGWGTIAIQATGTFTGTIQLECSVDGSTFAAMTLTPTASSTTATSFTATGLWTATATGCKMIRARSTSWTSGSAVISLRAVPTGGGGGSSSISGSFSGNAAASNTGAAVPASADFSGVNVGGNLVGVTGVTVGTKNAPTVAIVDGSGNQITSFGGGTQYAEGTTAATITGTAVMFESNTGTSALSAVSNSAPLPISDAGGSLTVDGTVAVSGTVAVTDNSGSLTVDNGGTFAVQLTGATNNINNISGTISLPTGAATAANQSTAITSLSSLDTKAVQERTADFDSGAGTVATKYVGIALPGSGGPVAGGTSTNPVRMDPTGTTSQPVTDGGGSLTVDGSVTVTQTTGTNLHMVCDSGCSSSSGFGDNGAFTFGTTSINPIGGVFDDTSSNTATENSAAVARITANKALHTNLRNASGTEIGTNANPLQVGDGGGSLTVDGSGNFTVVQATGTNLHMVCDSGCSSSTAPADNSAFTAGTTSSSPMSGFYHSTVDTVTDGRIAALGMTSKRALFTSLYTPAGDSAMNDTADSLKVTIYDASGNAITADTQATQDGALTVASTTGGVSFVRASAAAPTDVTADNDAVIPWALRSGAQVINQSYAGTLASTGNGVSGSGVQRVTIASDSTGTLAATQSGTWNITNVSGTISLPTGAATSANQSTANTALSAIQTAVELIDNDQTGWTPSAVTSAATNNSTSVKGSAGRISSVSLINTTATLYYLRLYNLAVAPTCSSATGFLVSLPIPASTTGAGLSISFPNGGIALSTGIGYCITAGSGSTDNTSASTGVFGIIAYK